MTTRELDRLVSQTELTPVAKKALRGVRRAVLSGRTGDTTVGTASWSVEVETIFGTPYRISFSFRRDK